MQEIPARLKRKIEALRKMAEQSVSENEAMIAAKQLHALLARHGIDSYEYEDQDQKYGTESIEVDHKATGKWAGMIANGIAMLYFCHCYQETNHQKGKLLKRYFRITGSANYRFSAKLIASRLLAVVDAEARATVVNKPHIEDPWAYICSFRTAAGSRINIRCMELIEAGKKGMLPDEETPGVNLPMLLPLYDREKRNCDDFLTGKVKLTKSKQKASLAGLAGLAAGDKFGRSVNIHHELGARVNKTLIGHDKG